MGINVIIFGIDMSASLHIDHKNKNILVLGEGIIQGLYNTTLITEAKYPITFTQSERKIVLSLHCNGSNSFFFVGAAKI